MFPIFSQLFYDGHTGLAASLSTLIQADPPCPPSDRLYHLAVIGLKHEPDRQKRNEQIQVLGLNPIQEILIGPGLGKRSVRFTFKIEDTRINRFSISDLEFETDVASTAPEPALYETAYVTSHKGPCRAGAFSVDGQLIATGSVDASIKVITENYYPLYLSFGIKT